MKRLTKELDEKVYEKMVEMSNSGRTSVRAGEMARLVHVDSCCALGAMLRVEKRVRGKVS